jgi:hypothetical protein
VERVTYLDADLFFFSTTTPFFEEFERSGKHVLITEHAYDPRYDKSRRSGRFCVQFLCFRRSAQASRVMTWWQDRCLEWCYARVEAGKFGDQKYLDLWPTLFASDIHILEQRERTLAPWNVRHFAECGGGTVRPVFYHFHGLRLISPSRLQLYSGYQVGNLGRALYMEYLQHFADSLATMSEQRIPAPLLPLRKDFVGVLLRWKRKVFSGDGYATLSHSQKDRI